MGGDQGGAGLARGEERTDEPRSGETNPLSPRPTRGPRDQAPGGCASARPRGDQHPVERPCPLGLHVDGREVLGEVPLVDAGLGHPPGIGAPQDVIRDAEDVEAGWP